MGEDKIREGGGIKNLTLTPAGELRAYRVGLLAQWQSVCPSTGWTVLTQLISVLVTFVTPVTIFLTFSVIIMFYVFKK